MDPAEVPVVRCSTFAEGAEIADRLRGAGAVLVDTNHTDATVARRLVDFTSGVAYALGGAMQRVEPRAFLVTKAWVPLDDTIRDELRRRLEN